MAYTHAKVEGQWQVNLEDRVETNRRSEASALPPMLTLLVIIMVNNLDFHIKYFRYVCYIDVEISALILFLVRYDLLQNFISGNKIEALLWISRLMTIFSTFSYFLPILGYD